MELGFLDLIEFIVIFQNLCRIIEYGLGAQLRTDKRVQCRFDRSMSLIMIESEHYV